MNLKELREKLTTMMEENPELISEIKDIYALAYAEVEQGGSEPHECELAYESIIELIEEQNNEK